MEDRDYSHFVYVTVSTLGFVFHLSIYQRFELSLNLIEHLVNFQLIINGLVNIHPWHEHSLRLGQLRHNRNYPIGIQGLGHCKWSQVQDLERNG